jgi:hypothetical protein
VWEQSRDSSQASLAAAGTAALREICSQLANDFDHCSAEIKATSFVFFVFFRGQFLFSLSAPIRESRGETFSRLRFISHS